MSTVTTIAAIYVPGLGDDRTLGQDEAVKAWKKYGVELEYHAVGWADGDSFEHKQAAVLERVDQLYVEHKQVALLGASAGAGCVLNVAAQRPEKVLAIVSICGKIRNANFSDAAFAQNPAFAESLKVLPNSLKTLRNARIPILSVNSLYDGRVPRPDTVIEGAQTLTMPMVGHVPTIAFALTFGKRRISRWITSVAAAGRKPTA